MPRINLLPWREAERKRKRQEFAAGIVGALVIALLLGLIANWRFEAAIDYQNERNQILKDSIKEVDKQIAEVLDLEQKEQRLLARMDVIEQLQRSRPEVVRLFDQFVRIVPDGVHLTSIRQTGTQIQLRGMAQSSTRVAAFMRNIESSEGLAEPALQSLENKSANADASAEFTLTTKQAGAVGAPVVAAAKPVAKKKPARKK
jgi:type IV pilus assembly protein PilN